MKKGFSYLMVIIIVTMLTTMAMTLFYYSKNERLLVEKVGIYSNDYLIGVGGIEKSVKILNSYLFNKKDFFLDKVENTLNKKLTKDTTLEDYIYYELKENDNLFDGDFGFKKKDRRGINGERNTYLKEILFAEFSGEIFKTNMDIGYTIENEYIDYLNIIEIVPDNQMFRIKSTVVNNKTNQEIILYADIALKNFAEKVEVGYKWRNIIENFHYALYTNKKIINTNSNINIEGTRGFLENSNSKVELLLNLKKEDYKNSPIVIVTEEKVLDLNKLKKYDSYVIINKSKEILTIRNQEQTKFRGIIYSIGDLIFENIKGEIEGNIICKNNIYFKDSDITILENNNIIFEIVNDKYSNKALLDSLGITNFRYIDELDNNIVGNKEDLSKILFNAKVNKIDVIDFKQLEFVYKNLVEKE